MSLWLVCLPAAREICSEVANQGLSSLSARNERGGPSAGAVRYLSQPDRSSPLSRRSLPGEGPGLGGSIGAVRSPCRSSSIPREERTFVALWSIPENLLQ